jgi:putative toxin-antitoxin system antitoxin component (TIGR02293 family)
MVSETPTEALSNESALTPTERLTGTKIEQLSELDIYQLAKQGFVLSNVRAMLSASELYSSVKVMNRIVPKSSRARQTTGGEPPRLGAQQSAVAFQFAKALEHAITVFGSQKLAEGWLDRPCRHLAGNVPLDLIDNVLGFQIVEAYLERVELGVYQ